MNEHKKAGTVEDLGEMLINSCNIGPGKRGIARIYITPHHAKYVATMDRDGDEFYDPKMVYLDFDLCDTPIRIHIPDFHQEITIDDKGIHIAFRSNLAPE